ncbi:MAG: hypothetical protein COA78_10945 [Blastopirellula sp.]|nr:MAG: hypothetical protein COA78_10945 [Blastopirellula sp.]
MKSLFSSTLKLFSIGFDHQQTVQLNQNESFSCEATKPRRDLKSNLLSGFEASREALLVFEATHYYKKRSVP